MDYKNLFAQRTNQMSGSVIREILKVASKPDIISLAGGLPAPETFPSFETIKKINEIIYNKFKDAIFQYGITEGFMPYRESVQEFLKNKNINSPIEEIRAVSGSEQAIDLLTKVLINKGDKIAVESPTYLGALSSFNPFEPDYIEIETDEYGVLPQSIEKLSKDRSIKFFYLIPNFQNPTGKTLPLDRRKKIAQIAIENNILIYEDDPYGDLRYEGEHLPTLKSLANENVVYGGSFSKIFAPGLRIGFFVAPLEIANMMNIAKQGEDVHTNNYAQAQAHEYLNGGYHLEQLPKSIEIYKSRKNKMIESLEKFFPSDFAFTRPDGGMFLWVEGPQDFDSEKFYWKAIEHKVAFVPGKYFFIDQSKGNSTMRLNFSNVNEEKIEFAIKVLGDILKK